MNPVVAMLGSIRRWWQASRARVRLLVGIGLVAMIGLTGLTPNILFGVTLSWPYAALVAAAGWGRSGLGFGPMLALILFGFAQDVTASAPLGCFALVNLATFGASAVASQTFDIERSRGVNFGLPMAMLVLGMSLVWILASFAGAHIVRIFPIISALMATLFLHMLVAPVFDLGVRRGSHAGVAA